MNETIKKYLVLGLLILIAFAIGAFAFRGNSGPGVAEYQERINSLTEGNQLLVTELRAAGLNSQGIEAELLKAQDAAGKLSEKYKVSQDIVRQQRELLDRLGSEYIAAGEYSAAAAGGIERAVRRLDGLIEEIQSAADLE